ncbi:MAG: hypothetical protein WCG14_04070 [Chlamydiia bacterium]
MIPIYSALWSIPLLTSALDLSYAGIQIKEYADPEELKKIQEIAKTKSYDELLSDHSIEIILTYHVLSRAMLQEKCWLEIQHLPYGRMISISQRNPEYSLLPRIQQKFKQAIRGMSNYQHITALAAIDLIGYIQANAN